jgi:anti-sigma regulatory factor (Ser/Thr protein kinase)
VRQFVRLRLSVEDLAGTLIDAAELIASELATNVVNHHVQDVEPAMLVGMCRDGASLRIEVHDTDPAVPKQRFPDSGEESGRGLIVVEALADQWGVGRTADGKFVWVELVAWPSETSGPEA